MAYTLTDVQVAILALNMVGERQPVTAVDGTDTSAAGTAVGSVYALSLKKMQEATWWTFLTKRAVLVQSVTAPPDEWGYAYTAPADMVVPRYVFSGNKEPITPEDARIEFSYENVGSLPGLIYCDEAPVTSGTILWPQLSYTYTGLETRFFPQHFIDAFSMDLAARLAMVLPVKPQLAGWLRQEARLELQKSVALDRSMRQSSQRPLAKHLRARGATWVP